MPQSATRLLPQAAKMPQNATSPLPQSAKMPQSATSPLPQSATLQQPAPKMLNRSVALWLRNRCQELGTWEGLAKHLGVERAEITRFVNEAEDRPPARKVSKVNRKTLHAAYHAAHA